ncbi:hypothetical protein TBLA_0E02970 [Henningerozyma blattae CBS 6284]|uniref:Large ribosomal subunit protein uL4m n=1 Tax=Henningerozyma blattae (strain ATCC 34711 / CBS 6284 / DSM 70876 / NBRC 10599 / NRRL Y-10934 / UCD 77-7) TaxID=1071380 RepID=I2H4P9_HENB6|nr:hypothetical protein TBLA_0E02970 [Tetrapisispora blattae CBS 6284]CCH61351.1 hypothetical protein TBLA_0E02970 [Tetrapisispora blattae CBS 6284]
MWSKFVERFYPSISKATIGFRNFAQSANTASTSTTTKILPNAVSPPHYTLVTIRTGSNLEPLRFQCVPTNLLFQPLRRDLLWSAVVYERDVQRVGASNPPSRSTNGYSRRKLYKQKGTGRARVGDANSPTRSTGGRALARRAPNDFSTELNSKTWNLAMRNAFSHKYREGRLYVLENNSTLEDKIIPRSIFITDNPDIEDRVSPSDLRVVDLLGARKVLIDLNALQTINKLTCK